MLTFAPGVRGGPAGALSRTAEAIASTSNDTAERTSNGIANGRRSHRSCAGAVTTALRREHQRDFLQERENCGARVACLTEKYDARIRDLNSTIAGIASRGPY